MLANRFSTYGGSRRTAAGARVQRVEVNNVDPRFTRAFCVKNKRNLSPSHKQLKEIASVSKLKEISFRPMPPSIRQQESLCSARRQNPRFINVRQSQPQNLVLPENSAYFDGPITPQKARESYSSWLTAIEQKEIENYPDIYFLGKNNKKVRPTSNSSLDNCGYDDANQHYKIIVGDHIAYRYEIINIIGKGAFGQVVRCIDHKDHREVALKVLANRDLLKEVGQVEAAVIKKLNDLDPDDSHHIIRCYDFFMFRHHICGSYELLSQNLLEFSRSNKFMPFCSSFVKPIAKQILIAIQFCHQNNIVHCDVKPENVMFAAPDSLDVNHRDVKLIDFGSSCFAGHQRYEYIQSRFYRSPEVILGLKYGPPVDMWSFGCLLAELIIGQPLFPAEDELEQLEMFFNIFGKPPKYIIDRSPRRFILFTPEGNVKRSQRKRQLPIMQASLQAITHITDRLLIDLLEKCFEWEQVNRITTDEALSHPWFSSKEISAVQSVPQFLPSLF